MDFDYTVMPIAIVVIALTFDALCLGYLRRLSLKRLSHRHPSIRRVLPFAAAIVVTTVASWCAYNAMATHVFWAKHPPAGRFEMVNGSRMHIDCTGSGSPTLVLDAGLGGDTVSWTPLQPTLSRTTQVCSYDRPGFGWSQAVPGPRDADHVANELQLLLRQAGVDGPLVLAGDSIAGLYIRDYAALYPSEVAGLIFVDSSTPFQDRNAPYAARRWDPRSWFFRAALILGVPRLIGMCSHPGDGADAAFETIRNEDICRFHYGPYAAELGGFDRSSQQVERSPSFGSIPILIFSHDPLGPIPRNPQSEADKAQQSVWNEMQENLKTLSTRSRRIIVTGGSHRLDQERPDLIETDVAEFIQQIRGAAPAPSDYGSTKRE
jgi:pimeloyl-ACP methyl ester carboxylesterase